MKAGEIAKALEPSRFVGNEDQDVTGVAALPVCNEDPSLLFWCADKNWAILNNIARGTIICSDSLPESNCVPGCNYILVPNPRQAFQKALCSFFNEPCEINGVANSAIIHSTALIDAGCRIGENVVIEKNVTIGQECVIGHNTVIKRGTVIANHIIIGANCTIGGAGFGYEKSDKGDYALLPHLGNVVIEDFVEVGNNTTIDRAVLGSTILRKNSKIDNLVHIAHGVEIGENSLIIANAMIAGSVIIGKNVWIAPSASILNQKIIGDDAVIGMGAVVFKNVKNGETIVGNPGKVLKA